MSGTFTSCGGWFTNGPKSTGARSNLNKYIVAGCLAISAGTGAHFDDARMLQHRFRTNLTAAHSQLYEAEPPLARSTAEDVARVREVISHSISDLAKLFNVSRQTIYNWISGEFPSQEHAARLEDLALAADVFSEAGIDVTPILLRRKVAEGKTFFEVVKEGGSAQRTAQLLAATVQRENSDRQRLSERFAGRRSSSPSVDADFIAQNG